MTVGYSAVFDKANTSRWNKRVGRETNRIWKMMLVHNLFESHIVPFFCGKKNLLVFVKQDFGIHHTTCLIHANKDCL